MKIEQSWISLVLLASSLVFAGCGDSGSTDVAAEQDEVAKWVAENPEPEPVPLDE